MSIKKDVCDRIAYYTRKVAEYGAVHPASKQPAAFKYRQKRLLAYKKRMHELIEKGRYIKCSD